MAVFDFSLFVVAFRHFVVISCIFRVILHLCVVIFLWLCLIFLLFVVAFRHFVVISCVFLTFVVFLSLHGCFACFCDCFGSLWLCWFSLWPFKQMLACRCAWYAHLIQSIELAVNVKRAHLKSFPYSKDSKLVPKPCNVAASKHVHFLILLYQRAFKPNTFPHFVI